MQFDAMKSDCEDEYEAFVEWLSDSCVREMKQVGISAAIEQYVRRGYEAHLSPSELTDCFCVSSNSVVEKTGLRGEEADAVVQVYDDLQKRVWAACHPKRE